MKFVFTTILITFTLLLNAQTSFEPATSLMNDNAVASSDAFFFAEEEVLEESDFGLTLKANPLFGDITIMYNLSNRSNVVLEVEKEGNAHALVSEIQENGNKKVLWDENIGEGEYTIRLLVDNKVQTKTVNLSF